MIHTLEIYTMVSTPIANSIFSNLGVEKHKRIYEKTVNINGITKIILIKGFKDSGYWLRIVVNPAKLLYGYHAFETVDAFKLDILTPLFSEAIEDALGIDFLPTLPEWSLRRMDYAIDLKTPYAKEYLKLFDKGDFPSSYKLQYNWRKGSCYCKSKSVTINAYYKMQQMLDEGKDPKDVERAKDILRFEIQCNTRKVGTMKKQLGLKSRQVLQFFSMDYAKNILLDYCKKFFKIGHYYSYNQAIKKMEALGKTKRQIAAISNVLKAIAQTRSISEARNQLKKGGINIKNEKEKPKLALSAPQFNRNCAKLEDMGINPVTIPRDWKIGTLDGIYDLIEKHFLEFSKANVS